MRLYSSVSFIFFGLISFQLLPLSIQQATESCNSTLPLNDLTFDTTLLQCVEAWTPRNYILRVSPLLHVPILKKKKQNTNKQNFIYIFKYLALQYARTAQNTWSFILSAPDASSFIGIGFSTNGQMIGASAVVGWLPTDGSGGQAKQYLLGGKSPGQVTPDRGDLSIVNGSLKVESVSSRIYMSFQLTADVPRPSLLYALGPAGFFPTSPGFGLREHRDMTTTTVDYNTGKQASATFLSLKKKYNNSSLFLVLSD